jgi:hypothetical protein
LRLDHASGDVFNIVLADFHCPLCNPPYHFFALEDVYQWTIIYNPNRMHREVMLELPGHHEDHVEKLLNLWVPCLSVFQEFTDKVH